MIFLGMVSFLIDKISSVFLKTAESVRLVVLLKEHLRKERKTKNMTRDLREWNPMYYLEAPRGRGRGLLETQDCVCLDICWSTWAALKQGQAVSCSPVSAVASTLLISVSMQTGRMGLPQYNCLLLGDLHEVK